MNTAARLAHLLLPRESNNHRSKVLHLSSLSSIVLFLVGFQILVTVVARLYPQVLGYAASIPPEEVIRITNQKRVEVGLSPLTVNPNLSKAALAKGTDMINRDYWAHVAPDGTEPWKFFGDVGYKYRYAGENLARDFTNPSSAVDGWMASESHRDNLLSPKYKEIGVAVVEGDLAGVDTTIVVQLFGSPVTQPTSVTPVAQKSEFTPSEVSAKEPAPSQEEAVSLSGSEGQGLSYKFTEGTSGVSQVPVSPYSATKNFSLVIVAVLLGVLIVDGLIVSRRRIVRVAGRSFAHVSFLGMVLAILIIARAGKLL